MRLEARLKKLEQQAAKLPPDGAALTRELERIPPDLREAWLENLTDEELTALCECDDGGGVNYDLATDEELKQMAAGTFDFEQMRDELKRSPRKGATDEHSNQIDTARKAD